jgi:hypothetical protein
MENERNHYDFMDNNAKKKSMDNERGKGKVFLASRIIS